MIRKCFTVKNNGELETKSKSLCITYYAVVTGSNIFVSVAGALDNDIGCGKSFFGMNFSC